MAKEKHNYHMFYFKNTLYTGNLNSGLKGTDFTCTQCMINNKNLECFTFSLIFQFFVWVPLKGVARPYLSLWELSRELQQSDKAETFQDCRVDLGGELP